MRRYKISHTTGFKYATVATASYNEVRMSPLRDEHQFVIQSKLEIQPSTSSYEYIDYFGTRVVVFEVLDLHDELTISSTSTVELRDISTAGEESTWETLSEQIKFDVNLFDASMQTRRTQPPSDLVKKAKKAAENSSVSDAALEICKVVYQNLSYKPGETGVHSNASEAWTKKVGVCQDFAHLALGALRAVGIPARYVSGYLHPVPEPQIGKKINGESHAWIEWFSGSWRAYDPTNDILVGDRHIRVGHGRDYDDISPLRGVFAGGSGAELFVDVEITREA